jgi:aldehyde dehydrogenase (NAD+)
MSAATGKGAIKAINTHYIDGAFVDSDGREVMDIVRPTNGQVIGRVTLADEEDTRRAIAAARRAFATYGRSTTEERAALLRRLHAAASARLDDLTAAMVEEYGGVVQFAGLIVQSGVNAFLAAEKALREMEWTRRWDKTTVTLEPVGVAGLITAWNANALFICLKLASAVAAGCTVVVKPSELSALQTQVLIEALHEAKLPKGLLNVVTGRGDVVGAELVRSPDVDKISFTGSVAVSETIMRDGVATMKRVTLELGGKSPTILLDDAKLDEAIPVALGMAFLNGGQACAAGTRLLVPRTRLDAGKRAIADAMRAFPVGDPADSKTAVGPMVSQRQYERVQSYIRKGIEEGAEVLVGGEGRPAGFDAGWFVKPTVFVNVTNEMTIAREEIFGPVLSVIAYDTEDDAIAIANDSRYGLHAAVIGTDLPRAPRRLAVAGRPGRDQRHDGRSAGALGRLQVFRRRPGIWPLWHRRVSRAPRHPRGVMGTHVAISPKRRIASRSGSSSRPMPAALRKMQADGFSLSARRRLCLGGHCNGRSGDAFCDCCFDGFVDRRRGNLDRLMGDPATPAAHTGDDPRGGETREPLCRVRHRGIAAPCRCLEPPCRESRVIAGLYSAVQRMRLASSDEVIRLADRVIREVTEAYAAPDRTFDELRERIRGDEPPDALKDFGEACRAELRSLRT